MSDDRPGRPTLLLASHVIDDFHSGKPALDRFLWRFALENQASGKSRTYVAAVGERVIAYYSLAPGSVAPAVVPERVAKGQGAQDIPVILLARLAVDIEMQGLGLGRHMLLDALRRSVEGAEVIGGRAVLVHAEDEDARGFYLAHDLEPSPTDPLHLLMLVKDIRKTLGS